MISSSRCSRVTWLVVPIFAAISIARADESKFLRYVPDKNSGGTLQASVVRYANKDGVSVDLVAAVHIAEPSFYHALDASFADYDVVLYELVAPRAMLAPTTQGSQLRMLKSFDRNPAPKKPVAQARDERDDEEAGQSLSWVGVLQHFLKDKLKLAFQLEEIDYERPNFIHADLDVETFTHLQEERGESFTSMMLNSMLHQLSNPEAMAGNQPGIGDLLFAMQSPDRARQLKLMFAKVFGQIDEQMAGMEGPNGSVILTERNKAAIRALGQTIATGKKSIAIFYGAGHYKGMEKMLIEKGFHQVGPPFWRIAWDMTIENAPTTQPQK